MSEALVPRLQKRLVAHVGGVLIPPKRGINAGQPWAPARAFGVKGFFPKSNGGIGLTVLPKRLRKVACVKRSVRLELVNLQFHGDAILDPPDQHKQVAVIVQSAGVIGIGGESGS